jgi:hypothetical protein
MPWLPIYAEDEDFRAILDWLNENDEIAFIVADGPSRWRAVHTVPGIDVTTICLWHVPSGPLPLLCLDSKKRGLIDPWDSWTEMRPGVDKTHPYFGAYHTGIIRFNARRRRPDRPDTIFLSSFEWVGNLHARDGRPASEATVRFWQQLRSWTKKLALRVPRSGPLDGPCPKIWAFPRALAAIRNGCSRADYP